MGRRSRAGPSARNLTSVKFGAILGVMATRSAKRELDEWLDRHGYRQTSKVPHPYATSLRAHARMIESPVTGREVFAARERHGHITTRGRRILRADQFALPPGPEEKRRGILGRLPIDTIKRARSALSRASMMHNEGTISEHQLREARRKIHEAWPEIDVTFHAQKRGTSAATYTIHAHFERGDGRKEAFWTRTGLSKREADQLAREQRSQGGVARVVKEEGPQWGHARMIESPVTGREVFATHERDHHITTRGRRSLRADEFALPPGPEEKRRGILGRLPIDTIKRGRNALARAAQMRKRGHITAAQLATVKRKVHAAWPSIDRD